MSGVGDVERKTQNRVVRLFDERLGYNYLGNWEDRVGNACVETEQLSANLRKRQYDDNLINRALDQLAKAAAVGPGHDLYEANLDVYRLLRYGVKVKPGAGERTETVWLIDWEHPELNQFAIAEEVTVVGRVKKRPDVVIYVNGIAIGVLELKRSIISVAEGIRQTIGNQKKEYIRSFFSTVQLVLAGSDSEGLRYGVIDTPEKYWLEWKLPTDVDDETRAEVEADSAGLSERLDIGLAQLCAKRRLLEIIHDFIVFDAGVKKAPRNNQYFGVKAAQRRVHKREGGIIWHTQGSGKSLTMVWLAKWIREHQPDARVLLITDRDELDQQIETVFNGVSEQIYRTTSGADLINVLNSSSEWLICSLVHKFRSTTSADEDEEKVRDAAGEAYIKELKAKVPAGFKAKGNIFVFVDEAHRTQSGKLHDAMQELLPGAMFIGFTGTPLLKTDKTTSIEKFGSYIHTYKFHEAVDDGVVLDLRYEARDIDQYLSSEKKIDDWFEAKTKDMTDLSKAELKKRWGTLQKVTTSEARAKEIVDDILMDMMRKPRLADLRGNAILVSSSVAQACTFYRLFSTTDLSGKVGIVTSYHPNASEVSKEDAGEGKNEKLRKYETYRQMLAAYFGETEDEAMKKVDLYETQVKDLFIKHPGQMRLLIVVDKLLTGFDAPSATYLYLDKKMRDHALFQAICRVNRLDGEDKDYGYIVDYRDLFKSLEKAVTDYTSDALDGYDSDDIEGLLTDRLTKAREDLEDARERAKAMIEPVAPPKGTPELQHYFCAEDVGNDEQIKANEAKRVELYKAVSALARTYANLANELVEAGYTPDEAVAIKQEVNDFLNIRAVVKLGAGEDVDFKAYEAAMRHLLDQYVRADEARVISDFEDAGLIDLIVKLDRGAVDKLPDSIKNSPEAVAETIANNVRRLIIDERALNPKFFDKMSTLLDQIIEERRRQAIDYEEYLTKLIAAAKQVHQGDSGGDYPVWANTKGRRALMDYLDPLDVEVVMAVDRVIHESKPEGWVGHPLKERVVTQAVRRCLPPGFPHVDKLVEQVKEHGEYH